MSREFSGPGQQESGRTSHLQSTLWDQRIERLPRLWVIEESRDWTIWLRRELSRAAINICRDTELPEHVLEERGPVAIAWALHMENAIESLESMWRLARRQAPMLQIALVGDRRLEGLGVGLREAGANHIQQGWSSVRTLQRLLDRFWTQHLPPPQDARDEVIRRLPLRPQ